MRKYTLYWTNFRRYEECPQKFLWYCGWPGHDVGGGDGRPKPVLEQSSYHHAVMGIVIGDAIEKLYNEELWRSPHDLKIKMKEIVEKEFNYTVSKKYIDYKVSPTRQEMLEVCMDGVLGFLKTLKANKLLGPYSKSEVNLVGYVNQYTPIGGRADIIIRRDDTGITILDGKNSKHKGKYTDPDQLKWYALCFYLSHNVKPDRLGFVYYRYPYGTPIGDGVEQGVDWIPWEHNDLRALAERAVAVSKGIHKEKFQATPSPKVCKFCDYAEVCPPRKQQKSANSKKKNPNKTSSDTFDGIKDLDF